MDRRNDLSLEVLVPVSCSLFLEFFKCLLIIYQGFCLQAILKLKNCLCVEILYGSKKFFILLFIVSPSPLLETLSKLGEGGTLTWIGFMLKFAPIEIVQPDNELLSPPLHFRISIVTSI